MEEKNKTRNMGILRVTFEAIEAALKLPKGTKITRIIDNEDWKRRNMNGPNAIDIIVDGEGLPVVWEGAEIPWVMLHNDGSGTIPEWRWTDGLSVINYTRF